MGEILSRVAEMSLEKYSKSGVREHFVYGYMDPYATIPIIPTLYTYIRHYSSNIM